MLYPVLVQLALELIQSDKDNTRVRAAQQLLDLAAADHSVQHREQYLILRGLFRWEHVTQSSLYAEFSVTARESGEVAGVDKCRTSTHLVPSSPLPLHNPTPPPQTTLSLELGRYTAHLV